MKFQRCVWAVLLAAMLLGSFGISEVNAFGRRTMWMQGPGYYPYPAYYAGPGAYYDNPYIAPLPWYGILPPPLAVNNRLYGNDYRGVDTSPRKRPSLFPAEPEQSQEARLADSRRVRFEITVPYSDAIVTFDGAKTKQTGLTRQFFTVPMQEDKEYTVIIDAQWKRADGTLSAPRPKTFKVVAGEKVQHTFKE